MSNNLTSLGAQSLLNGCFYLIVALFLIAIAVWLFRTISNYLASGLERPRILDGGFLIRSQQKKRKLKLRLP